MKNSLLPEVRLILKNDVQTWLSNFKNLLFSVFILFSSNLLAQQKVTGKVTTGDKAVAGATINVKGTSITTQTNEDGVFSISAPANGTLIISSVGFGIEEVKVTKEPITIQLQPTFQQMGEVVVIGYGSAKKRDLTGAVASIKGDDLKNVTSADASSLLQGKAAGVVVQNSGGAPGQAPALVIRGSGTFGNDQPLYIIDGMIASSMAFINSNDIASIEVLKDASAAAIYGSRAANGVVLVTTKSGTAGDIKINFSVKYGSQNPTNKLNFLDARQYADWNNSAHDNDGTPRGRAVAFYFMRSYSFPILFATNLMACAMLV